MQECIQSRIRQFFPNSWVNNSACLRLIGPIIQLILDLLGIYILTKFGADSNLTLSCTFTCFHDSTTLYQGKQGGKIEIDCQKQLLPFPLNVFYPVVMTTTGAK